MRVWYENHKYSLMCECANALQERHVPIMGDICIRKKHWFKMVDAPIVVINNIYGYLFRGKKKPKLSKLQQDDIWLPNLSQLFTMLSKDYKEILLTLCEELFEYDDEELIWIYLGRSLKFETIEIFLLELVMENNYGKQWNDNSISWQKIENDPNLLRKLTDEI
jgi:hypothetical protein